MDSDENKKFAESDQRRADLTADPAAEMTPHPIHWYVHNGRTQGIDNDGYVWTMREMPVLDTLKEDRDDGFQYSDNPILLLRKIREEEASQRMRLDEWESFRNVTVKEDGSLIDD